MRCKECAGERSCDMLRPGIDDFPHRWNMVGQGSPNFQRPAHVRFAPPRFGDVVGRRLVIVVALMFGVAVNCYGAEKTVRLRLAWGSGSTAKQRWHGQIEIEGGVLTQLAPLGIEPDASVAVRIDGSRLVVAPLQPRGFDGCDVTVRADEGALVRVELQSEQSPQPTSIMAPLAEIVAGELRRPLDQLGSFFVAHRAPGDRLRVIPTRDALVFRPDEAWSLRVEPDLASELASGPLLLEVQLRSVGLAKVLWKTSRELTTQPEEPLQFDVVCPAKEGAYRLTLSARPQEGLATRFVPGQQARPVAARDVEFVVIDPTAALPQLADQWEPLLSVDPANPRWWQRLPTWAQVPGLRGRLPGATGNVRPVVRPNASGDLVELPASTEENDPYWQAYTLPVRAPGEPHLVEIEYPLAVEQHLSVSIIEPDAADRVMSVSRDAGFFSRGDQGTAGGEMGVHRFMFWPRTESPQLLLINRHPSSPAEYGVIRLSRHDDEAAPTEAPAAPPVDRLVAGYISRPVLAKNFAAAERLDAESGMSVQSWSTFLDGARRLVQHLRFHGYNAVVLSVAADGSAIYPSPLLNPSPRYDTGLLAASGQDPQRKDVLEMLLRICDREGIRVVPTLQLAAPLPRLEQLRKSSDSRSTGIGWIGPNGQGWLEQHPASSGLAPYYNSLNDRVRAEMLQLIAEITERYRQHRSLAGVGLQLSGLGYGVLPDLTWGVDDQTVANFSADTGIEVAGVGPNRFRGRAEKLLGQHRTAWTNWRAEQLSKLYVAAATTVGQAREDLQLVLTTEDLFAGPPLQQRLRESLAEPVKLDQLLLEHGLHLAELGQVNGIVGLAPYRLGADNRLGRQALDLRINSASQQGELAWTADKANLLLYHAARRLRMPSFDQRSPFGSEQTHLTLTTQAVPAGADYRQQLITALARRDADVIIEGGPTLPRSIDAQTRSILRTLGQLPGREAEVRTQTSQPLVMRVYRAADSTIVTLINEAPWPVSVRLPIECSEACNWQRLGDLVAPSTETAGALDAAGNEWQLDLEPYDLRAWRFDQAKLRLGQPQVSVDDVAQVELAERIREIEARTGNLNIERVYAQLQNPGFELEDGGLRIVGWQTRLGGMGAVKIDAEAPHQGQRALRLNSRDPAGVAVVSHQFPMPETGQLSVSAFVRAVAIDDNARLLVALEDVDGGRDYRRYATLGGEQPITQQWTRFDFPVDDIPLGTAEQMRVHFHLTGDAEILIDDVELCDLRFDDARRGALAKRIYAAKIALEQGHVMDCLQVVDEYWSRYLVEYVPPLDTAPILEAKQPAANQEATEPDAADEPGLGQRLRGWFPRVWR